MRHRADGNSIRVPGGHFANKQQETPSFLDGDFSDEVVSFVTEFPLHVLSFREDDSSDLVFHNLPPVSFAPHRQSGRLP